MACRTCHDRKIKCDRTRPVCTNCRQRNAQCVYTTERGRGKRRRLNDHGTSFTGTYRFVEPITGGFRKAGWPRASAAVQPADTVPPRNAASEVALASGRSRSAEQEKEKEIDQDHELEHEQDPDQEQEQVTLPRIASLNGIGCSSNLGHCQRPGEPAPAQVQYHANEARMSVLDRILDGIHSESLPHWSPAVWIQTEDGGEYTGPSSGLSSISDMNLKWLRNRLHGSEALFSTLEGVRRGLLSHLRQPKCITTDMWPSPDTPSPVLKSLPRQADIDRYVDSYFSDVQVIFPILDRAKFNKRLSHYYQDPTACTDSWKALLNAVIASGCRAVLSDETAEAFQHSGREAWAYFRNALCYETKIVHGATDLTAVQALVVMAVFAQGMSSPQRLEFTLCSTASRLAQGLALSVLPPTEWNMTEVEKHERDRTFWVIYCLDKSIALRCGRPPTIRDSEINCVFPRDVIMTQNVPSGGTRTGQTLGENILDFDFFLVLTKLSRIDGRIALDLYSVAALYRPATELLETAKEILSDLESWRQSFPPNVRPGQPFNRLPALDYGSRQRFLSLHFSYYHAICAIHRRFTPMFTHIDKEQDDFVEAILPETPMTHIEAARSIVLLTKHLDIESYTPGWLVFYYPMTALVTIFMHVIHDPLASSTSHDIALMDAVVGFFGRLEYVTSGEAAFTQMGEFVRQVRHIVATLRDDATRQQTQLPTSSAEQDRRASVTSPRLIVTDENIAQSNCHFPASTDSGSERYSTAIGGHGTVPQPLGRSSAAMFSQVLQDTYHVPAVAESTLVLDEDPSRAGILESAELPDGNFLNNLAMPILGLSPGSVPSSDWLDAWISPRQIEGLGSDLPTELNITGR